MVARSSVAVRSSSVSRRRVERFIVPVALFLGVLALYLVTLTQVHTFDALSYVTSVERKPWTEVLHPHHLAYGPLGTLAMSAAQWLGYTGGAAVPMQIVNALAGAAGVSLFYVIVQRVTQRVDLGLLAALLLSGAFAYWYYAVEIEVYTVASLFLLLALLLLIELRARPIHTTCALLGVAQGGAILFHQTNVLFCFPVAVALLMIDWRREAVFKGQSAQRPLVPLGGNQTSVVTHSHTATKHENSIYRLFKPLSYFRRMVPGGWVAYAGALALTVGLPYLFAGAVSGFRSLDAYIAWLTEYARTGWWGGPLTLDKWARLGKGVSETLAQPAGALLWLLLIGLLVVHMRSLKSEPRWLIGVLLAWLAVYAAFFFWWEPDNVEFWIASLPPVLLLLALALRGTRQWGPGVWIGLSVAVTAMGMNYDVISRRGDPTNDLQRVIASALGQQSEPADLLLVPDGLLELYLPYYERHDNFVSLNQALFDNGGDWGRACQSLRERIDTARYAGAAVLVADEVLRPQALLLERHRLSQSQIDDCFAPYRVSLRPLPMPPQAPVYWWAPKAQALADAEGWRFAASVEGWRGANLSDSVFDGGWRFTPGVDPALTSPLLNLDASRYRAIIIQMANDTGARDAQLFYSSVDGQIDEQRSLRWTLDSTSESVTYELDLQGAAGWEGTITRLRIDPVGVGDGGAMRVEAVRLVLK